MAETVKVRTARKPHRCEECCWRSILRGHRYEVHTVFPGHDVLNPDRPIQLKRCLACASARDDGAPLTADACGRYCHGRTPCAKPFDHNGECSCREDARTGGRRG